MPTAQLTLYHNPRCSQSRQALVLLEARGAEVTVVKYLETPPSVDTLTSLIKQLNLAAHALVRSKEPVYQRVCQEYDLTPNSPDHAWLQAMAAHPALIQRPILTDGARAVIGRPPENVLQLLS